MRSSKRTIAWSVLVAACFHVTSGNKPVFDLSNSMRLVLLPVDAGVGQVIYKLRASDADEDYPLTFRAFGDDSNVISVENVDCSLTICSADVVLKRPLDASVPAYRLSLEVKDTRGERTVVKTEIQPTAPRGAFIGYKKGHGVQIKRALIIFNPGPPP